MKNLPKYLWMAFLFMAFMPLSSFSQTKDIEMQFIFDTSIKNYGSVKDDIKRAIKYGNEVFSNSQLPYRLRWVNSDEWITLNFSSYKNKDAKVLLDDLGKPTHWLGKCAQAWLGNDKHKRIVIVVAPNNVSGTGLAKFIPNASYQFNKDSTYVWMNPSINSIGTWVLVHEVAHLFGATHCASIGGEDKKHDNTQYDCSRQGIPRKLLGDARTVMSKNFELNGIPYFSTPNRTYAREALGDGLHDNEKTLKTNMKTWTNRSNRTGRSNSYGRVAAEVFHGSSDYAVYGLSNEGYIESMRWYKGKWTDLQGFRHPSTSKFVDLTAVSWGLGQHGLYAVGESGTLLEMWRDLEVWKDVKAIGGPSGVKLKRLASVSWALGQYGIYAIGHNGALYEKWWNGSKWSNFTYQGNPSGVKLTEVSAVCWSSNNYGIYAIGTNGQVYERWWNGSKWSGWNRQGAPSGVRLTEVSTVAWGSGKYGIYAVGSNGNLYQRWWNGSKWSGWSSIGRPSGTTLKTTSALSYGAGKYAIYCGGADGKVYQKYWDGSKWSGWRALY